MRGVAIGAFGVLVILVGGCVSVLGVLGVLVGLAVDHLEERRA